VGKASNLSKIRVPEGWFTPVGSWACIIKT
jgi:hypothetical protein